MSAAAPPKTSLRPVMNESGQIEIPEVPRQSETVTTIEETGKKYKGQMAIGCLTSIIGLMFVGAGAGSGMSGFGGLLILIGILIFYAGRIGAWWHHG